MPQILNPKVKQFQKVKAKRRNAAIAKDAAPGAPNATIAKNVLKWQQEQKARLDRKSKK